MNLDTAIQKFRTFYARNRRLPTHEEICQLFNYSSKFSSLYLVKKLIEAQVLEKDKKGRLSPKQLFAIPQLGTIRAGGPTPAEMLHDSSIDLYEYILNMPGAIFSLVVRGDSMIGEGITEGDIVIVEKGREPRNGDVVAACVDNEWTVKYFQREKSIVALLPANPKYQAIYPRESLFIGGVVISVIRKYH